MFDFILLIYSFLAELLQLSPLRFISGYHVHISCSTEPYSQLNSPNISRKTIELKPFKQSSECFSTL